MSRSKAEEEAKPKSDRVTASRASSCPRDDEKKKQPLSLNAVI